MRRKIIQLLQVNAVCGMVLAGAAGVSAATLDEVLQDVVVTNPGILEKQKAYNAALAEQQDARSGYLPKVIFTGGAGFKQYRDSETGYENETDGFYDARITVSQLVYDWGRTSSLAAARKDFMLAALYSYIGEASQVSYDTIVAYLDVLKYNELQELAAQNVATHENLLESIRLQVERGKKGRSELERISGRMASAQSKLLMRQNDYKRAIYTLHKMLGRFTPVEEMAMPQMDMNMLPASLKEALELQAKFNPLLREAFYTRSQKEWEYKNRKRDYLGRLSIEGSASVEDAPASEYETEAKVGLRYDHTLFDAGRSHRLHAAASRAHEEQQKGYRVRRTLLNDIQLSWAAHKLLTEQIGVLKKNLYFTRSSLESYKKEFVLGRRSLINILDAQNENQYVNEQLIDAVFSREVEKYKVLLSEGVLLGKLGLLNPLVETMIEKDSDYVPLSSDELPLSDDFDRDTVKDDADISMNSRAGEKVNRFGVNSDYDLGSLYETTKKAVEKGENIISQQDSLKQKPMQLNVTTRFDFDAFLNKGTGLTEIMTTRMMKELVKQARAYGTQTPLYITVSSNEYESAAANYALSLKRAYTLKRILQRNRVNDNGVFVFADANAPQGHNILRIRFVDTTSDYQRQYVIHSVSDQIFAEKESRIENSENLDKLLAAIARHKGRAEVILYSNELGDMEENRQLGLKRAALLRDYMAPRGLDADKLVFFSWGSFREDPLLPESRRRTHFVQYILRDAAAQ